MDTRSDEGVNGRVYAVSFAGVWDLLVAAVAKRTRWELIHQDEDLGLITVACRGMLKGRTDDLTIWVRLDRNGLTRVDVRSESRSRSVGERRIRELMERLDRGLGPDARVRG